MPLPPPSSSTLPGPVNESLPLPCRVLDAMRRQPWLLPAAFLLGLWLQLFLALSPFWALGTYYDYGWLVPLAAGWLFWKRWQSLPSRLPGGSPPPARGLNGILLAALLGSAVLVFGLRVVERYDPYWRPPVLLHAALVCVLHHLVIARVLGWKSSAFFAPVTVLCLTAVPPPQTWEQAFIGHATGQLMAVAEPLCRLLGLPVELAGSALMADGAVLEIDEGCSGIRSFQGLLTVAVFAGEWRLLRLPLRLTLVVLGFGLAFLFNLARVLILALLFFRAGEDAFHSAHDVVGMAAFLLSALALLGSARFLQRSCQ